MDCTQIVVILHYQKKHKTAIKLSGVFNCVLCYPRYCYRFLQSLNINQLPEKLYPQNRSINQSINQSLVIYWLLITQWVRISLRQGVLNTTFCDKVCHFTNKTDRHEITEILLKVALNTITPKPIRTMYIKETSNVLTCKISPSRQLTSLYYMYTLLPIYHCDFFRSLTARHISKGE